MQPTKVQLTKVQPYSMNIASVSEIMTTAEKPPARRKAARSSKQPAAAVKSAVKSAVKTTAAAPLHQVLVVGAGFAGLGSAIRLRQAGIDDVVILERGSDVGGTWRDNQYPGAACDIPSNLYSYSFAQNPDWSRSFSGAKEILGYIHHLVDAFQLRPLIRFRKNVTGLSFDEKAGLWTASIEGGESLQARAVVMAQGPLSNSSWPAIPGLADFEGHKIHSARWDHDYDFTDKRVA